VVVDEGDAVQTATQLPGTGDDGPVPEVPGYELGAVLARGGTSEVWAGVAHDGGRRVVVKVVHADLGSLEAAAREAAVSARAASAHVVAVEACVPLADGRVAVVMPHLLGGPLDALVRARGHLSPGEVVTVLAPVASALGRLHDLGVVHGDVSPGNVLLDLDGRPVLGDLGLGHVVGDVSPGVWGTQGYVAPEVLFGAEPTPASDVYALGAVGWLCLSGTVPGPPGLRPSLEQVCRAGEGAEPVVAALSAAVAAEPADRPGAHELAWLLFGTAEPEPLRLVHGDDEVSAVTYRLRAAAGRPPSGRHAGTVVRRGWGRRSGSERRRPARRRVTRAGPGAALLCLVLVALFALPVGVVGRAESTPRARHSPEAARDSAAGREPAARGATSTVDAASGRLPIDPRDDVRAPRSRPVELLGVLADARAAAWREAAPALLDAADAPGSAASVRDAAAVAELVRAGVRYSGLRFEVVEAATVTATDDRAVLRTRIDTGAYAVTDAAGTTPRGAVSGAPVLVDLVRTDAGWRLSDLRAG
jgi:hypothetical protein